MPSAFQCEMAARTLSSESCICAFSFFSSEILAASAEAALPVSVPWATTAQTVAGGELVNGGIYQRKGDLCRAMLVTEGAHCAPSL